jgi:hypothetical protein
MVKQKEIEKFWDAVRKIFKATNMRLWWKREHGLSHFQKQSAKNKPQNVETVPANAGQPYSTEAGRRRGRGSGRGEIFCSDLRCWDRTLWMEEDEF